MSSQDLGTGSEENKRSVRESEERYRRFIEHSTEGIWRFELEEPVPINLAPNEQIERFYRHCYLAECNNVMARMYGYSRAEEIVGARLNDLLSSSIPENIQYLRDFVLSGYRLTDAESQEVDRYGRTKYFLNDLTGIVENECLLRVWGTQRDITERKQAEEVRARLAAIVESSEDAIIAKTLDGVITDWNRGAQKILGKLINILVPPDRPNEIPMILERLRRGEAIEHYETVRVAKDGRRLEISLTISLIRNSAGKIVCSFTISLNITERKRAEQALKESERLYRTVIEQATENIFLVDAETRRIVESNSAFQETLGYTEEELRSMTLYDIVAADRKSIDSNIRLILEQKQRSVGERKYRRKDGSLVDVEVSVSTILRNGRETLCDVAHDITESKRREEAQRFLAEVGATLSSSLDYRATLASVARLAVPRLADWCAVDIVEEDGTLERLAVEHEDLQKVQVAHELQERYPPDPETPQGLLRVLRSGQSEFYPDITDEMMVAAARDAEHLRLMRELGFVSLIFVPLVARGRTLGVITLVSAESGRRYREADLELAEELARHAALAVDNARLYRGRVQVARTLQEGLLPSRLPEVPGVEVGLRYVSAGEVDVGGDFYDLFNTRMADQNGSSEPSSSWGIVIGDVSGKGAEAAAMLAFARYTLRTLATRESCPSTILSSLNEAMLHQRRECGDHKFCTVAYVRLETEGNKAQGARFTVSRGGHPPPFLLRTDGSIYKVGEPGRVIGVFEDVKLTEQEASLAPGEALILYTDGVVEARSPDGLFFGEERLKAILHSSVALDASTIASRIEDAVLNFQEQDPRDDIAVLVLRVSE